MGFYKSNDNGASYQPWHFYVSSENTDIEPSTQCREKFNMSLGNKPASVNDVICRKYPNETAKAINDTVSVREK